MSREPADLPPLYGIWPVDDLRRAFVEGAKWWEWRCTNFSMWPADRDLAEEEAERRYPNGKSTGAPAAQE